MKIVNLDGNALNPGDLSWEPFREFGELTLYERTQTEAQVIQRIGDAEVILLNKVPITDHIMAFCPNLKLICVLATGYNVIDCTAAKQRGITVCNVPDYGTASVAQFTFALLLELCHRVGHHDHAVHQGKWCDCPNFCFWDTPQMELAGKTFGIIGFGRIGRAVGAIAKAMGMRVIACNRSRCAEGEAIGEYLPLDEVLERSDILSLHCPLTPATENLINRETLAKMKDGAILLNTARGAVLDEEAVKTALESGKLRGAAVDVTRQEPLNSDSPLLTAPNCIITPHMAWTATEARQRILDCTMDNIRAYLAGNPIHVVNL
jgi:glycerate dehydrogenase